MTRFRCGTCGEVHEELPLAFGPDEPHAWFATPPEEDDEDSVLTSDQCILQRRDFFVRGCLDAPIRGTGQSFRWLVWVKVSEADFDRISDLWEEEGREVEPAYTGWLDTVLPGYPPTLGLEVRLQTMPVGERPQVRVHSPEHPLAIEQAEGIGWEQARARTEAILHPSVAPHPNVP